MRCKHCGNEGSHHCSVLNREINEEKDSDSFWVSAAIGALLHDTPGGGIIGGLVGGDLLGGLIGDTVGDLFDSDED